MSDMARDLSDLFRRNHVPVFGMAPSSALEKEALGYRPSDVLEDARSILCFGVPVPRGTFRYRRESEALYWRAANVYYRTIDAVVMKAAAIVEESGDSAAPVFGCFPYTIVGRGDFRGIVSLVAMGEAVGIGKKGKNGLLFSSRYGPRLLMGGLVTSAELSPETWPQGEEKGCPEDCRVCVENCPVSAIDEWGRVDGPACAKRSTRSPLFSAFMKMLKPEPEDVRMLNHLTAVDDHSWYQCIACVATCPYL